MSVESTRADAFIYNALSSDTMLVGATMLNGNAIYNGNAPQNVPTTGKPFVVFHNQSHGADVNTPQGVRQYMNIVYLVQVIKRGESFTDIESIADRIDQLLHRTSGPDVLYCWRIRGFHQAERNDAGQEFRHLGGFYRLYVQ